MFVRWTGLALLLVTIGGTPRGMAQAGTAIRHVTVVDVLAGVEVKDRTVRIEGEKIVSVKATVAGDETLPGALDGNGGFLIPGLWDMHVHVHDAMELPLYVANGVTGVRVMSGAKEEERYRAYLERAEVRPRLYLASAIVDGPSPAWPGSIVVKNAADGKRVVGEIKAGGADFIKVYDGISREAYFALAAEAKAEGIAFEGHVPTAVSAQDASAAGQRSVEHLTGVALGCSSRQDALMAEMERAQFFRGQAAVRAQAFNSLDQEKCRALLAEFRQNQTWQAPTLTVLGMWGRLQDSHVTADPNLAYVDRASRERWTERTAPMLRTWNGAEWQLLKSLFVAEKHLVGSMYRAGVPMLAGTDAMNPYCLPGFGLHQELALLVESGLTPLAALQAATVNTARFMGRTAQAGTIDAGKDADLVLLRADPLKDIHNTTTIAAVWVGGRYFDAEALADLLAKAKLEAKK